MKKIAVAGSSGYLGKRLLIQLAKNNIESVALARNVEKLSEFKTANIEIKPVNFSNEKLLENIFSEVDTVISALGITRQKDGVTYLDVDYGINKQILEAAKKSGVKKFIYISVLHGQKMRHLKICEAKESFVDELVNSGLEYTIIRPTGFFSDMNDFLEMAKKAKVYLFGNGNKTLNPIHGKDLANAIIESLTKTDKEIKIGGPDIFSQNEIAELAFQAVKKPVKIIHLPDWIRKLTRWSLRKFTNEKTYGPAEFFLTAMNLEMTAPQYGTH